MERVGVTVNGASTSSAVRAAQSCAGMERLPRRVAVKATEGRVPRRQGTSERARHVDVVARASREASSAYAPQNPELAPRELLDQAARLRLALGAFHSFLEEVDAMATPAPPEREENGADAPRIAREESHAQLPERAPACMSAVVRSLQSALSSPAFQGTVAASLVLSALDAAQVSAAVLTANPEVFATEHAALAVGVGAVASAAAGAAADAAGLREAATAAVGQLASLQDATHQSLAQALQDVLDQTKDLPMGSASGAEPEAIRGFLMAVLRAVADVFHDAAPSLVGPDSPLASGLKALTDLLHRADGSDAATLAIAAVGVVAVIGAAVPGDASAERWRSAPHALPDRYDLAAIEAYLDEHPLTVLRRTVVVSAQALRVGTLLLLDWHTGAWERNMDQRAEMCLHIIEDLGPSFIKLAQLMSTRVDMMPPAYLQHFSKLQDRVRPFSTADARDILTAELGCPPEQIFQTISAKPVAAASIGQVYRGILQDHFGGQEVAIKIQRPNILENSSLDLFVIRKIISFIGTLPGEAAANIGGMTGLLDEWASRFFLEMDYCHEAANAKRFQEDMRDLQIVRVPTVFEDLSTKRVLVTEWVHGEKLSESKAEDVKALVTVMLNCYLVQLLETGFLHADPHPGNLIRTPDGKICVLDFGLMGEVSEEQRQTLVEFIAHLCNKDWRAVVQALHKLGFIPDDAPDPDAAGVTKMLGAIMGQIVDGGGAGRISISTLMSEMEGLAASYPLRVPGYFALVLRAFGVLEGIALKADPEYSIVGECFPYLSRRLLSDNSEHSRVLLRKLLYTDGGRLDVRRVQRMAQGFRAYSMETKSGAGEEGARPRRRSREISVPRLDPAVKDALFLVFSAEGSYVQDLFVEEMVAAVDVMSREAASEVLRLLLGGAGVTAALGEMEAFGPMTPMMLQPVQLPLDLLSHIAPVMELSEEDEEALDNVHAMFDGMPKTSLSGDMVRAGAFVALELAAMAPALLPGVRVTVAKLVRKMALRIVTRLGEGARP